MQVTCFGISISNVIKNMIIDDTEASLYISYTAIISLFLLLFCYLLFI